MAGKKGSSKRRRSRPVESKKKSVDFKIIALLAVVTLIVIITVAILFYSSSEGKSNPIAVIETSMGTIKVELYKDKVPNTCDNFIKLANEGFYDGLVFHRVIDDFVIQGGGFYPNGTNKESPYGSIDLEINDEVTHVDGAIAMARTSDPNSATSQFYICDGPQHDLDDSVRQEKYGQRGYAVFGVVVEGMDVVRNIASVNTTTKYGMNDWPVEDVIINRITIEE